MYDDSNLITHDWLTFSCMRFPFQEWIKVFRNQQRMKWISKKFTTIFTFTSRHPGKSWNGVDRKFDKKVLIKIISLYLLNHIDMATRTLPIHHFSLDSFMQQVFYWQKLFSTSHPLFWSEKTQNRHRTSKRWWHFSFFFLDLLSLIKFALKIK